MLSDERQRDIDEPALAWADRALVTLSIERMNQRTRDEIEPFREALQVAISPGVRELAARFGDVWALFKVYSVLQTALFLEKKRAMAEPRPYAGGGACAICCEPAPDAALDCCGGGMHRNCWLAWRLSEPRACPLCRRALTQ